jgi:uncharacterized protein YndB with AHSA1/START domain
MRGSFDDRVKGEDTMFTIDATIDIVAPLSRVRTAITTEAGFRAWLAQDTDFDGRQVTFRFAQPTETRAVTFAVDRCDEHAIVMTCVAHENNDSWLGTSLAIDLRETPTGTRVHLVHGGYRAKNEVYERSSDAWPYFLRSLAKYMLTGAGEPYPKAPKERVMGSDTRPTAMLILRNDGVDWAQLAADGRAKALFQQFVDWVGDLQRRGVYAGVEGLQQSGGRTVRRKGAGLVIDGPFAEGREAVLGVILVRVKDIDEACAIAGESPHVEVGGAMEVRMVAPFPKP